MVDATTVAAVPDDERARLAELDDYDVVDSARDGALDVSGAFAAIVAAAALVAGVPMAAIGLVAEDREKFLSVLGMDLTEIAREQAICDNVVKSGTAFVVEDMAGDSRFADHPYVAAGALGFYGGFPLRTPGGHVLGSLCVMAPDRSALTADQRTILGTLADQAMAQLELRRQAARALAARDEADRQVTILDAVLDSVAVGILITDAAGELIADNVANRELLGVSAETMQAAGVAGRAMLAPMSDLSGTPLEPNDRPLARTLRDGQLADHDMRLDPPGRPARVVRVRGRQLRDAAGGVIGAVISMHDVTDARHRETDLAARMRDVEQVAAASRKILSGEDGGAIACKAVQELCHAQQVSLLMPDGSGNLTVTSSTQPELRGLAYALAAEGAPARAFLSGQPLILRGEGLDVIDPTVTAIVAGRHGPVGGAFYLPLLREDECQGVLAVTTGEAFRQTPIRIFGLLEILTAELSTALDRDRLRHELAKQAGTDPLTGLANRRTWDESIEAWFAAGRDAPACLAILDLDHFKAFNDERGHQAGDELLRQAATAWTRNTRQGDLLARLGGEEFGVLLTHCALADAARVVNSLLSLVPGGQSASAGVAELRREEDATAWYARADLALYQAKSAGRNRLCVDDGSTSCGEHIQADAEPVGAGQRTR